MSLSITDRNNANKRFRQLIENIMDENDNEKNRSLKAFAKKMKQNNFGVSCFNFIAYFVLIPLLS
jgi:signal transduction histidine kinase